VVSVVVVSQNCHPYYGLIRGNKFGRRWGAYPGTSLTPKGKKAGENFFQRTFRAYPLRASRGSTETTTLEGHDYPRRLSEPGPFVTTLLDNIGIS
jgi:hypothetical protein